MNLGSGPVFSLYLGVPTNGTIAASMAGTAAATQIMSGTSNPFFTASGVIARSMEVFNLTGRNLELILGKADGGTADYQNTTVGTAVSYGANGQIFVPGTASAVALGRGMRFPIAFQAGMGIWARTTENTPLTASSTTPLIINFWA